MKKNAFSFNLCCQYVCQLSAVCGNLRVDVSSRDSYFMQVECKGSATVTDAKTICIDHSGTAQTIKGIEPETFHTILLTSKISIGNHK